VLLEQFPAADIADRLSGLVIGHEIRGAAALGWTGDTVRLIGDPALCGRYSMALDALGLGSTVSPQDAAVRGFARLDALK
jgi:2-dehydro-3-deoxygalactonokinase